MNMSLKMLYGAPIGAAAGILVNHYLIKSTNVWVMAIVAAAGATAGAYISHTMTSTAASSTPAGQ